MTPRLITPSEAIELLRRKVDKNWPQAICDGTTEFSVPLRPNVSSGAAAVKFGREWTDWHMSWRDFAARHGTVEIVQRQLSIQGLAASYPAALVADLDTAVTLLPAPPVDVPRARALASSLRAADATLTPSTLRAVYNLEPADTEVLLTALTWLRSHPDASAWTARQLPIPGMHTKWLETHGTLLHKLTGRDVRAEVRPRLAVLHLTYIDPDYLASGRRRHDAWTTGDTHELAYRPRLVLVVENRDCRLWFPPLPGTIVVEGNGKAAASLLADVPWLRAADHVVYWGDMDADGYAILNAFRAALAGGTPPKPVASILMDDTDLHRYADQGVNHDKSGHALGPSETNLPHLTEAEQTAYAFITTKGPPPFRRIEQEAIPLPHAAARLRANVPEG
ncbi:Wadjet anti-phage system protein JetD domain-containing protein [Actinomadura terrae]|uniref:Wadjet anti-phage system protein JetD domain-containing protein n=1 Tax=Actinomadura terrae TaxID=604353 RepID=UPI001FA72DD2|nr:Wadjet anti-phage system protein JetD domain-containing protein [Actinomadura terrae]